MRHAAAAAAIKYFFTILFLPSVSLVLLLAVMNYNLA
jgi:hypothetical protein